MSLPRRVAAALALAAACLASVAVAAPTAASADPAGLNGCRIHLLSNGGDVMWSHDRNEGSQYGYYDTGQNFLAWCPANGSWTPPADMEVLWRTFGPQGHGVSSDLSQLGSLYPGGWSEGPLAFVARNPATAHHNSFGFSSCQDGREPARLYGQWAEERIVKDQDDYSAIYYPSRLQPSDSTSGNYEVSIRNFGTQALIVRRDPNQGEVNLRNSGYRSIGYGPCQ